MALFSFSRLLKTSNPKPGLSRRDSGRAEHSARPRFVPRLEALEGRLAPAVLTVNTLADQTTADNFLSLREAVGVVDAGSTAGLSSAELAQISGTLGSNDTIQFRLPSGPQTITLTGALDITNPVTVKGTGAGSLTISGNNLDRVFVVGQIFLQNLALGVAISDLTVSGGSAVSGINHDYGGGLLNFGTLTVSNVTFSGNAAGSGGGGAVYNVGALTLNSCTFTRNTAGADGGGIRNISSGTLTVSNCTFSGNSTTGIGAGAGLANSGTVTTTVVSNSTFSGNTAANNGGGIFSSPEARLLLVSNSTFSGNTPGSDGGGIDSDGFALSVTNSTFSGNSAASQGGAMENKGTLTGS